MTDKARSGEKRALAVSRAAAPMRAASLRSMRRRRKARSSAPLSPGATRKPLAPSDTTSGMPPTGDATTGTPALIPSSRLTGSASADDGSANTAACSSSARLPDGFQEVVDPLGSLQAAEEEHEVRLRGQLGHADRHRRRRDEHVGVASDALHPAARGLAGHAHRRGALEEPADRGIEALAVELQ